ncbi:sulfatase [Acidobacteriota bacterium]
MSDLAITRDRYCAKWCIAFLACLLLFPSSCNDRIPDSPPNLLLITMDTVRADHLSCYGYARKTSPIIDRLASQGVRFEDAYCEVPITAPSHATMLTGLHPSRHGVRTNGLYVLNPGRRTLAEILEEKGYQTAAFLGAIPLDHRFGLNQGFQVYDDDFSSSELSGKAKQDWYGIKVINGERRASEVVKRALSWLRHRDENPFFLWVHLFDPHSPYAPPPPFTRKFYPADPAASAIDSLKPVKDLGHPWHEWLEPYRDLRYPIALYDGEIAYADNQVGKLLEGLEESGEDQRTVICLVADHGESLTEHNYYFFHGDLLYEPSLRIPWLMVYPSNLDAGLTVKGRVQLADLMPTVLDLLGVELPAGLDGTSLVPAIKGAQINENRPILHEALLRDGSGKGVRAIRSGDFKLIAYPDGKIELFNIAQDPVETFNIAKENNDLAMKLHAELKDLESKLEAPGQEQQREGILDPQALEALRSLGYTQ